MGDYEKQRSAHFDELAKDLDRVCEHRLKDIHQLLSNERPPYPPPHTVTLARAVHVLAMRALADTHPAKYPRSKSYASKGRHGLHLYWMTVFRLNEGISGAAQAGALSLRDSLTGFPNANFRQPSKERAIEWEQAAITRRVSNQTEKLTFDRRAVEIMCSSSWALLDGHFDASVVVSLSELDAWAVGAGITDHAGVSSLLESVEAESAERARITAEAIAAEERGEAYDPATSGAPENAVPPVTLTALPEVTIDTDDGAIAKLFDPVKTAQLEAMFPDGGKWASYTERADRNGLKNAAKDGRATFNPYSAAVWWLATGPNGWALDRCLRVLANNLPARSIDSKHLLTGEYE